MIAICMVVSIISVFLQLLLIRLLTILLFQQVCVVYMQHVTTMDM